MNYDEQIELSRIVKRLILNTQRLKWLTDRQITDIEGIIDKIKNNVFDIECLNEDMGFINRYKK